MQWLPSPQYQGMPHDQYMKTSEGQRAQQAFTDWNSWASNATTRASNPAQQQASGAPQQTQATQAPNMSAYAPQQQKQGGYNAYAPGKAQPTQTQSQGTPYGTLPPTGSPATSYADAWNASMPKGGNGVQFTPARSVVGPGAGNMAYAQPGQRPEGFVTQSYDLQGNPVAQGQQAQQRDAFITQIIGAQQRDAPPVPYDFQGMLGKANDMVQGGWQNPFNFNQPSPPGNQLNAPPVPAVPPQGNADPNSRYMTQGVSYLPPGGDPRTPVPSDVPDFWVDSKGQAQPGKRPTDVEQLFAPGGSQGQAGYFDQLLARLGQTGRTL